MKWFRLGAIALVAMVGVGVRAPVAGAAVHRARPKVFLDLQTQKFTLGNGYSVRVVADRLMSGTVFGVAVDLQKSVAGPTVGETAAEDHYFGFDVVGESFGAYADLNAGHLRAGTKLGRFGSIRFHLAGFGTLNTRRSCRGYVRTEQRRVDITGAMSFTPDTNGQSYFGTITQPETFSGILYRTTIKPHRGGCGGSRVPTTCPTGQGLEYGAPEGLSGFVGFAAVAETDPTTSTTTGLFGAERFTLFGPRRFVAHVVLIRTPDTSWLTVQSDLSAGHVDTDALGVSWVSGAADYAWDSAAGTNAVTFGCGGHSFTDTQTVGNYSAPISVTFDGAGTVASAVDTNDDGAADSVAPTASSSAGTTGASQTRPIMGRLMQGSSLGQLRAFVGA